MPKISNIDLIRSFSQGEIKLPNYKSVFGNCSSIALIKACVEVFGLNNVIEYTIHDEVYFVSLKNGIQLEFTKEQLERSNVVSNFQLNAVDPGKYVLYKEIYEYAQLLMCTMAIMISKLEDFKVANDDFELALKVLNNNVDCRLIPKLLGLENYYIGKTKSQRFFMSPNNIGMYAWFYNHTVYMSEELYDYRGIVKYMPNRYPNRIRIVDALQNAE
jgi:hypothetical protein